MFEREDCELAWATIWLLSFWKEDFELFLESLFGFKNPPPVLEEEKGL